MVTPLGLRFTTPQREMSVTNPSTRRNRSTVIVLAAMLVAVLALAGVWLLLILREPSDEEQIQQLVQNFAIAIAQEDPTKIAAQLCQAEATQFADSDAVNSSPVSTPKSHLRTTTTSDLQVVGGVASARVTRSQTYPTTKTYSTTLYFRKENHAWKVCASAAAQFKQHH